jgi:hypothetical protein
VRGFEQQRHPLGPITLTLSQREGGTLSCAPSADAVAGRGNKRWSDLDHPSGTEHGEFGGGQAQLTHIDLNIVFSQTRCGSTAGSGIAAMR